MEPNPEIHAKFPTLEWFSRCGVESDDFLFPVKRVATVAEAIAHAQSDLWADAKTEAQGDLTGYLAKNHYNDYGDWNRLGDAIEKRIQNEVMPKVNDALGRISAGELSDAVLLDLNRIALQSAYAKRFRRVPDFFQKLFAIYERGHLPCGWSGDLQAWPEGQFIVY